MQWEINNHDVFIRAYILIWIEGHIKEITLLNLLGLALFYRYKGGDFLSCPLTVACRFLLWIKVIFRGMNRQYLSAKQTVMVFVGIER